MKTTALIMAGGRGERFWPKSRMNLPKQFLSLTEDSRTMIQLTVERISPLVAIEDVFVATNESYRQLVRKQLPDLPEENILCEPVGRNTAPCIGLGAAHVQKKYGDAVMVVLPSDHLIKNNSLFAQTLKDAVSLAEQDENLVTIGITPEHPETGYGYIKFDSGKKAGGAFRVERFVEKPDLEKAKEYVDSGEYLWNSGMFIWKASTILARIKEFSCETHSGLMKIKDAIGSGDYEKILFETFSAFTSESIDYAVMEKATKPSAKSGAVFTFPGAFGWDDVGSWLALERLKRTDETGSVIEGNVVTVDSSENIIQGGKKLIAAVGLKGMVIVDTDDAILICQKQSAWKIKGVLEKLKNAARSEYL
ncbi:MAG: NTP transferase domain-containing protein [Treponemataceae bacterium]|nr:NTP transferase domain-containing protein [Treponemataceae bacterium]